MNLVNVFKNDDKINLFCVHPGWIRTDGKPDNPAHLYSYEVAEILRKLFEEKRNDKMDQDLLPMKVKSIHFKGPVEFKVNYACGLFPFTYRWNVARLLL